MEFYECRQTGHSKEHLVDSAWRVESTVSFCIIVGLMQISELILSKYTFLGTSVTPIMGKDGQLEPDSCIPGSLNGHPPGTEPMLWMKLSYKPTRATVSSLPWLPERAVAMRKADQTQQSPLTHATFFLLVERPQCFKGSVCYVKLQINRGHCQ